ncbi:MAG: hypothetical protein BHW10_03765 [Clostridium sp. CAG:307_30_263]|nr:MAG: hypothetical protein BHW10_03765 [Clostridium sp. CAG:307_30_263]
MRSFIVVIRVSGYGKCKHKVSFGNFSDYGYFKIEEEAYQDCIRCDKLEEKIKNGTLSQDEYKGMKYNSYNLAKYYFDDLKKKYGDSFEYECYFYIRILRIDLVNSLNYFMPCYFEGVIRSDIPKSKTDYFSNEEKEYIKTHCKMICIH